MSAETHESIDSEMKKYQPRSVLGILHVCLKFLDFNEYFFSEEQKYTSSRNTFLGILILSGINAILTTIYSTLYCLIKSPAYSCFDGNLLAILLAGVILFPIIFFLGQGIIFFIAKILGGKGAYVNQAYLGMFTIAPIIISITLTKFLILIPYIEILYTQLIAFSLWIFSMTLFYHMIKVVHGFSSKRINTIMIVCIILLIVIFFSVNMSKFSQLSWQDFAAFNEAFLNEYSIFR